MCIKHLLYLRNYLNTRSQRRKKCAAYTIQVMLKTIRVKNNISNSRNIHSWGKNNTCRTQLANVAFTYLVLVFPYKQSGVVVKIVYLVMGGD